MEDKSLGACNALIYKIQTTVDGGARITLDLNPEDSELLSNLLNKKMRGEPMVYVAFVESE